MSYSQELANAEQRIRELEAQLEQQTEALQDQYRQNAFLVDKAQSETARAERQATAIQAAVEALEKEPCKCERREGIAMSIEARKAGCSAEIIRCDRCFALTSLREAQGA